VFTVQVAERSTVTVVRAACLRERHIQQMRMLYDQRRQVLVQALNAHLGKRATILGKMLDSFDGAIAHIYKIREIVRLLCWCGNDLAQPHYLKANCTGEFIFGYSELTEQQLEGICVDWLKFWWSDTSRHANAISSSLLAGRYQKNANLICLLGRLISVLQNDRRQ